MFLAVSYVRALRRPGRWGHLQGRGGTAKGEGQEVMEGEGPQNEMEVG